VTDNYHYSVLTSSNCHRAAAAARAPVSWANGRARGVWSQHTLRRSSAVRRAAAGRGRLELRHTADWLTIKSHPYALPEYLNGGRA